MDFDVLLGLLVSARLSLVIRMTLLEEHLPIGLLLERIVD